MGNRRDRLRRIGTGHPLSSGFGVKSASAACADHLFAIIAMKLALLLMAVGQELLGQVGYSPIWPEVTKRSDFTHKRT